MSDHSNRKLNVNNSCMDASAITVRDILRIDTPEICKLHLAGTSKEGSKPLDEFVANRENWVGWNKWKGAKNDWTREFIFSLIEFYPLPNRWLFGGIFRVLERCQSDYRLEEVLEFSKFVGRLLVSFHRYQGLRGRAYYLENFLNDFEVAQIFPEPYTGEVFCGYQNVRHDFHTLEAIFANVRPDWYAALRNIKGVYAIVDKSNGMKYVGSACGEDGIWSRWSCYLGTGHGWNDELTKLIRQNGITYARTNFRFSLLETMSMSTPDDVVIEREFHWKNVLMTREHGYNNN